jgi:pimeloyl-ACP methyl ester carboxylesterase
LYKDKVYNEIMSEKHQSPMDKNPISAFNLNVTGNNPDVDLPQAKDVGLKPAEELVASEELKQELANTVFLTDPDTGQKFEALHLNQNSNETPIIMTLSWSVDNLHAGTLNEAEQTAIQTGRPMWIINNPNTASSDKLTKEQQIELENGTGFDAVSVPMLRSLKAAGVYHADFEGTSMGARLAVSLAANAKEFDITVGSLVIVDPPGMTDRSLPKLTKDFVGENPNLARYNEIITSQKPADTDKNEEGVLDMLKYFAGLAKHGLRTNFVSYTKAMARDDLPDDLIRALSTQEDLKVTFIFGTASNISNPDKILQMYNELFSTETQKRVRLKVLPGDTHALGAGNRISWHITEALKRKE